MCYCSLIKCRISLLQCKDATEKQRESSQQPDWLMTVFDLGFEEWIHPRPKFAPGGVRPASNSIDPSNPAGIVLLSYVDLDARPSTTQGYENPQEALPAVHKRRGRQGRRPLIRPRRQPALTELRSTHGPEAYLMYLADGGNGILATSGGTKRSEALLWLLV